MRVAVVGGSGALGSHLTKSLQQANCEVRIVDLAPSAIDGVEHVPADVRDFSSLERALAGCDAVVNLAAVHRDDVKPISLYSEVNVGGAQNVCAAADVAGVKTLVFTSTIAVYGTLEGVPDEAYEPKPTTEYGRTKLLAEGVYKHWQEQGAKKSLVIVRPVVLFGPGIRGNLYTLMQQVRGRKYVMIGAGCNKISMAYAGNVAAFLAFLATTPKDGCRIYNYADKPDFNMQELIAKIRTAIRLPPAPFVRLPVWVAVLIGSVFDIIGALTEKSQPISRARVTRFCAERVFAAEKFRETGFVPPFDVPEALNRTIATEFLTK